jgi:ribose/xylose/arabinose/galactoside ABC-type transport system permease subunit
VKVERAGLAGKLLLRVRRASIFWAFLGLFAIMAIMSPAFISPANLLNVGKQISVNGILAIGMTFVLISGGIDLSVGSTVALTGVCAAYLAGEHSGIPLIIPVAVAMSIGGVVGVFNGMGVVFGKLPPFIMTLAAMITIRGLAEVLCDGSPVFGLSESFNQIGNGFVCGIPNLVLFVAGVALICLFALRALVFGKWLYAIGGNEEAAKLSGINIRLVKVCVYVISGVLAGLCGVLVASRIASGSPVVAVGYELNAIAAAVIGGVSLSGGSGNLTGTVIGALIIGVIQNGLDIQGVSPFYQEIVQGLIIMAAVFLDTRGKQTAR